MPKKTRTYFASHIKKGNNRWERNLLRVKKVRRAFNELSIDEQFHSISEKYRYIDDYARQQIGPLYWQVRKRWIRKEWTKREKVITGAIELMDARREQERANSLTSREKTLERLRKLSDLVFTSNQWDKPK